MRVQDDRDGCRLAGGVGGVFECAPLVTYMCMWVVHYPLEGLHRGVSRPREINSGWKKRDCQVPLFAYSCLVVETHRNFHLLKHLKKKLQ